MARDAGAYAQHDLRAFARGPRCGNRRSSTQEMPRGLFGRNDLMATHSKSENSYRMIRGSGLGVRRIIPRGAIAAFVATPHAFEADDRRPHRLRRRVRCHRGRR
jgi:hypothetical protein